MSAEWSVFFEGAGGFTTGLRAAGFTTHGYEYWTPAVETARANGHTVTQIDLSDPANDDEIVPTRKATFSPPCQPFSVAGDGGGEFDERDGFPWTLRIIERFRYDLVVIENVKGLTLKKHRAYFAGILAALKELGYEVEWRVLNCADFGVPQTRERCIIIARRDGLPIVWPMPTHTEEPGMFTEPWVTMAQALGWGMTDRPMFRIPAREDGGGPRMDGCGGTGARAKLNAERAEGRWQLNTRTLRGIVDPEAEAEAAPTLTTVPAQWCWERPSTTIAGDPRVMAPGRHDPEESGSQMADAIRLTIPELACLQGFPADYVWCGTKTAQAKQVGNAVPPILAQRLAGANAGVGAKT